MYIVFRREDVFVQQQSDGMLSYTVPTACAEFALQVLVTPPDFQQELRQEAADHGTDLFYKVDSMIKSLQSVPTDFDSFWLPCFHKSSSGSLQWMNGFAVSDGAFVQSCEERIDVELSVGRIGAGALDLAPGPKAHIVKNGFVVVGLERSVDTNLDIPLFACYIRPEEFTSAEIS